MVAHNVVAAQQAVDRMYVSFTRLKDLLKKGDWQRAILEVDFTNGMVFLQEKDRVIAAQPFADFKKFVVSGEDFEDNLLSLRFTGQQWQVMTQNSAEKATLSHLLQCVSKDLSAEDTLACANPGLLGLNKTILRAGVLVRKAKTQFKKDDRYLVLVPGKLYMFKSPQLSGQHVRYVTSLMGASIRMSQGLEFEVLVPGTKELSFAPLNMDEMAGWMGAMERSVEIAQKILSGQPFDEAELIPPTANPQYPGGGGGIPGFFQPSPSSGAGIPGFFKSASHYVGAYQNPQDSRGLQQRMAAGDFLGTRTGAYSPPSNSQYGGNYQAQMLPPVGGTNFQISEAGVNYQNPMTRQTAPRFFGQSSAGPSEAYNQPNVNYHSQGGPNPGPSYTQTTGGQSFGQGGSGSPQTWGPSLQNPSSQPGEPGMRYLRRATQTLRDFNNNMDQFLSSTPSQGYGGATPQSQTPGYGVANPQLRTPGYGVATTQSTSTGYGSADRRSQTTGYGIATPQLQTPSYGVATTQSPTPGYGGAVRQSQTPGYGIATPQSPIPGYGRGGPQLPIPGYSRSAPQSPVPGYGSAPPQSQIPGYGGAAPQMPNQGYGRANPQMQNPGYGRGASQVQNPGYGRGAPQGQTPGYGPGSPQMQNPRYGPAAPQVQNPAAATSDWKEFTSPEGRKYYHNAKTKQTTWEKPY